MANLLKRMAGTERSIMSLEDYAAMVNQYGLLGGMETSYGSTRTESVGGSYAALAQQALQANGVVFACMMVRQLVFSSVRFRHQRLRDGKPSDMFGSPSLRILETPAPGETTQDMLSRAIQDADLAGNAYNILDTPLTRLGGDGGSEVMRMRPDWIDIVVAPRTRPTGQIGWRRVGYIYTEGGKHSGNDPVTLGLDEVSHFAPIPDPMARFRGMSWLTPVIREIENDSLMSRHKRKFFENGGTPNLVVKHAPGVDKEAVLAWAERVNAGVGQLDKAYKTLNLYPGADATVVGKDLRQIDFKQVQGAGETRIAAAAGVPPIIVGLSEGLESATYSNYAQARRRFADGTMHPLWQNMAGSLAPILPNLGNDTRLWYDADDIPFLREDEKDAADITQVRATTLSTLVAAGYTPESAAKFLMTPDDFRVLEHTGLYSVQLQKPGADAPTGEVATP